MQAITGATAQIFTPTKSGHYAVAITQGACADTSDCVFFFKTGIEETNQIEAAIYPNPNNGHFTIDLGNKVADKIIIRDVAGKEIYQTSNTSKGAPNKTLAKGVYLVEIFLEGARVTKRVVVF